MDDNVKKSVFRWIFPSMSNRHVGDDTKKWYFRSEKAREQCKLSFGKQLDEKKLVECVNEFLGSLKMKQINFEDAQVKVVGGRDIRRIDYAKIRRDNGNKEDDIVWIKLSKKERDGEKIISVVGATEDIFFTPKRKKESTSGRINKFVDADWFEDYVYIFPLLNIPSGLNRSDIESGIGNYLIAHGFPILDFYSHIF